MDSTFRQECEAAAERWQIPALAVGASFGDREETVAIGCSPDTRFRVASITKPFTAALALRSLELDAPATVWPDTTRRDLLSHLSGYDCECGDVARFGDGDDALERLAAELPSVRRYLPAGRVWSYSNAGYWLAGLLCARARQVTYEELVAGLATELGLEATGFDEPDLAGTGRLADGAGYPRARRPSGGLVSTVADLLRFGRWLLADPVGTTMRQPLARPTGGVYGLGLAGERAGGLDVWGHGGSYGGFQSSLLVVGERDSVFVGLTNSSLGRQALRAIEDVFLERVAGGRRQVPETVPLAAEQLAPLAGVYANRDVRTTIATDGSRLVVSTDGETMHARPIGERTFEVVDGERTRERFDFPLASFLRIGSRLAERVA